MVRFPTSAPVAPTSAAPTATAMAWCRCCGTSTRRPGMWIKVPWGNFMGPWRWRWGIRKLAEMLGAGDLGLTTHSFRRSGASELARQGVSLPDILLYGRWLSEKSAREYIRRGEVAIYRARNALHVSSSRRIELWSRVGLQCWHWFDVFYKHGELKIDVRKLSMDKLSSVERVLFGGTWRFIGSVGNSWNFKLSVSALESSFFLFQYQLWHWSQLKECRRQVHTAPCAWQKLAVHLSSRKGFQYRSDSDFTIEPFLEMQRLWVLV